MLSPRALVRRNPARAKFAAENTHIYVTWWRHDMETLSAFIVLCEFEDNLPTTPLLFLLLSAWKAVELKFFVVTSTECCWKKGCLILLTNPVSPAQDERIMATLCQHWIPISTHNSLRPSDAYMRCWTGWFETPKCSWCHSERSFKLVYKYMDSDLII